MKKRFERPGSVQLLLLVLAMALIPSLSTAASLPVLPAVDSVIQEDLSRILQKAQWPEDMITWERNLQPVGSTTNTVQVQCQTFEHQPTRWHLRIKASPEEWSSTLYYGLQRLGFLFPHPRLQVSPTQANMSLACGQTWVWKPRLAYRGFHLHMEHPSEWVHGFLMGKTDIATDTIRWLARNQQNLLNLMLVREDNDSLQSNLTKPLKLAKAFGIHTGINVSFNSVQQKSFYLERPFFSFQSAESRILKTASQLIELLPFDFLSVDMGSTEFTSSNFTETLSWINATASLLKKSHRRLFMKAHVSLGQQDPQFGNFNYLAQWSSSDVGVLPHSVLDFSLRDLSAPVYGRKNLADMKTFLLKEARERPTWYFPETSYFIGMDIDVPLLLTDYLNARSQDMDFLEDNHIEGQLNFTTGQELGYWLMDWTVALLANSEYRGRPMIGLELLGEDLKLWSDILDFQTKYFKQANLLAILSSSSLLDEVPFLQPIFERVILRQLKYDQDLIQAQKALLALALKARPSLGGIKNPELKSVLQTTWDRIEHCYWLRAALLEPPDSAARTAALDQAEAVRNIAAARMLEFTKDFNRYPEALIFEEQSNPTSYPFGYGWPAKTLHFWEREEQMIRQDNYSPWFMNIYSVKDLLT